MKKGYLLLKLAAGLLMLAMLSPQLCHAAFTQILYLARYNKAPVFGTDTLGGVTYTTISYEDLMNSGAPGMPSMPVDYIRFSVPYNATNFTVTATLTSNQPHYIDHLLYPCQVPRMMNDTTPAVITLPDSAAYYSGSTYPTQTAWVVDEGFLDGENHIVTVAVMPFHYVHTATSDLVAQKRMVSVKLKFDLSDTLAMYPIVRNDSLLREEGYRLTRSMVVNPNQVKTFAPSQITILQDSMGIAHGGIGGDGLNWVTPDDTIPNHPGLNPTLTDTTNISTQEMHAQEHYYPYLIVTTSELYHSMRRIAALKKQKGYNVRIVTMDQVLSNPLTNMGDNIKGIDGSYHVAYSDDAGKLRNFLRFYYKYYGTKYVLLAGSSIPYRSIEQIADNNFTRDTIDCVSDFYYIDLNSDWSTDTISDYAPDLYVGRIFAKDPEQIDNYTDKLLRYELNPGNGDYSYLKTLIYQEGLDFKSALDGFKNLRTDYFPQRLSLRNYNISGREVIDFLNSNPSGLINIFNHGDTTRTMVSGAKGIYPQFFIHSISSTTNGDGLNCMSNRDYPMIFYSSACATVPFDNKNGVNMGESFTTGKEYGGPVYIGYTRKIATETTKFVTSCFAEKLNDGYFVLGVADALSVWDYKNAFFKYQNPSPVHAYIGDPSLEIWTGTPHLYQGIDIRRTDNSVTISGIDTIPTTVVYCIGNTIIKRIATDTTMCINESPNGCLMLYGHNSIPYIAPMVLQNVNLDGSHYLIAGDFVAGNAVDTVNNNRTCGDVIIKQGANYEIEVAGTTTLHGGFQVEAGASFSIIPSSY